MTKTVEFFSVFGLSLTMLLAMSGCLPKPAALTDAQISGIAENILQAVNANDYQRFVQDFSDQMKSAFTEDQFTRLRDLIQNASGNYLSMAAPRLSNSQGYAIYRFPCKFDNEDVTVTITFALGGDKVEGLLFDSPNLRKTGQ